MGKGIPSQYLQTQQKGTDLEKPIANNRRQTMNIKRFKIRKTNNQIKSTKKTRLIKTVEANPWEKIAFLLDTFIFFLYKI